MKKKKIIGLAFLVLTAVAVVAYKPTERYFEIAKSLDIFATLFKEVNAFYVDDVNPNTLVKTGIDAMLE
jgi:carboxyl-terminal processing protease